MTIFFFGLTIAGFFLINSSYDKDLNKKILAKISVKIFERIFLAGFCKILEDHGRILTGSKVSLRIYENPEGLSVKKKHLWNAVVIKYFSK